MPSKGPAKNAPLAWPAGPLPFVEIGTIILWLLADLVPSTHGTFPVNYALTAGLFLFRSQGGLHAFMVFVIAMHIFWALYTLRICLRHKLPTGQVSGWVGESFLLGIWGVITLNAQLRRARLAAKL